MICSISRPNGILLFLSLAFFCGCTAPRPALEPAPVFPVPEAYVTAQGGDVHARTAPWWEHFDDAQLNTLMDSVLASNLDIAQARARISQASAFVRQARALELPQVGIGASLGRTFERDLDYEPANADATRLSNTVETAQAVAALLEQLGYDVGDFGGGGGGRSGGGGEGGGDANQWETQFTFGPSLNWELDLWGRLRALTASEQEELAALLEDLEALRLLLSAQVAETYFEAVEQRMQLALLVEQEALASTFLELLELRFLQGSASSVDLLQQRDQLAEIASERPVALSRLGVLENRLDVLAGVPPDGQDRTLKELPTLPVEKALPAIGVPAGLLQQRPDVRAAQRRVISADYQVGAAMAERLPQVTLDGSLGFSHVSAGGGAGIAAGLAAQLFQPLLDWGLRAAQVSAAEAVLEQSLLAFSQTYLLAIEEVETTLWQEARQRERIAALAERAGILERTVEEAQVRYSLGVTDYLPVITGLQQLQSVQRALLLERNELVRLRIQLHRAVGGATSSALAESYREGTASPEVEVRPLAMPSSAGT